MTGGVSEIVWNDDDDHDTITVSSQPEWEEALNFREGNTLRVRCEGAQCDVWVNGKQIIKADLAALAKKAPKVTGLKRATGYIGLQNHSSPVHYRNIQVKRLK